MSRKIILVVLAAISAVLLAACIAPTPEVREIEVTREVTVNKEVKVEIEVTREVKVDVRPAGGVPYEALWQDSAHGAVDSEPFRHWDASDPAEVPAGCTRCHTTAGYQAYLADPASTAKAVPAPESQGVQCIACHNPTATNLTSVTFPGKDAEGQAITVASLGDSARCMVCHQGNASKASVDGQIARFNVTDLDARVAPVKDAQGNELSFGFINIHYFAAAATLYGTEVKGGYEYAGQLYDWKHGHVQGYDTCIGCHDPHSLEVKVEQCAECHEGVKTADDLKNIRIAQASAWDYDGDGNTEEGMYFEIQGLQEILLAQIQKYAQEKAGAEIQYDAATYPYFLSADGKAAYKNWTARLLKAAYNYQVSIKDPGAFAHGNKYIVQLLHDFIADLGGDVSKLARDDAGHFAGNTMPFRDWDDAGQVPFACAKCHSATGLPQFIKNGGTVVFNARGATTTAGVDPQPVSNGFLCTTCHDAANFPNRLAVTNVPFPSGVSLTFSAKDDKGNLIPNDSNLCIECHQGRESTNSVTNALRGKDPDTVDKTISFKNIHYFAAGATLFGNLAKGMYQYPDQAYNGAFTHGGLGPTTCVGCHNAHTLEVELEACSACHKTVKTGADLYNLRGNSTKEFDFDGDGNAAEGLKGELEGYQAALYTALRAYAKDKAGMGIVYAAAAYPYFFVDKDGDGKPDQNDQGANVNYNGNWTPRLLEAAYNYQYSMKDPGAFAHNGQYVFQVLYDTIADLGGDVTGMIRPAVK